MKQNKLVIHLISSLRRGGRERQLANIYKYSDSSRVSTKIVCLNRTPICYLEEYGISDGFIFLSSKKPIKRYLLLRRIVKESNADIIWSWGGIEATYAMLLSLTLRIKHINGSIRHGIVLFNLHQLWRLVVLHLSKNIVANSHAGLRANRLNRGAILLNGIDGKFFNEPKQEDSVIRIREEIGITDDIVLISSVANFVPYKDYDTILKALKIIKSKGILLHYVAIGEGIERKRIELLTESLNLSQEVSFLGDRTDIRDILYSSNIFIHSSLGEGCSNAILEAMSVGLPIIASDTGGTSEVVDDSIGRLFEYQNVEQLAEIILELICNKSLREVFAENSKKKAQSYFSIERMMSDYYSIIEGV